VSLPPALMVRQAQHEDSARAMNNLILSLSKDEAGSLR